MFECLNCRGELAVRRVACAACGLSYEGDLEVPRLARLSPPDRELVEALVLSGGHLSRTSELMNVSYPTLRKRVDALIERLLALREADGERVEALLGAVEKGELAAEAAARRIRELGGGE